MPQVRYNVPERLSKPPAITDYGRIADPENFSAVLTAREKPLNIRATLKPQADGLLGLAEMPRNFHAAIRWAEAIHNADTHDQPDCAVQLFQGLLLPQQNFGVIDPHIDTHVRGYPDGQGILEDSFIISDALTTIFYKQGFELPATPFAHPEDFYWKLSEIFKEQVEPESRFIPEPHHLVRFPAFSVHASQLPDVPTQRTAAILHFY